MSAEKTLLSCSTVQYLSVFSTVGGGGFCLTAASPLRPQRRAARRVSSFSSSQSLHAPTLPFLKKAFYSARGITGL